MPSASTTVEAEPRPGAGARTRLGKAQPPDIQRVLWARSLRAFGDGYVAILLPFHLASLGYDAFGVGIISTASLLGSALLTLALGLAAFRIRRRPALLAAALLMLATGLGFAGIEAFWPLLVIAFVGTLNPSGGDVSVFLPLEHTVLSHIVADEERTAAFARYSFVGAFFGALGALSVGVVDWLAAIVAPGTTSAVLFSLYGLLGLLTFLLYRDLSPQAEAGTDNPPAPLSPSRGIVYRLAALFSVDAFGGGLVINALLTIWLSERFGIGVATIGAILFVTSLCSAVSYFAAVPLARRFGLVNTMVFTHLPSNLFLILTAFAPTIWIAFGLLILRSLLSQMDVPARSSYVMAVVRPEERPAAASVTAVPRSLASAVAPLLSGWLLTVSPFGWPLVLAGTLKAAYDLTLLRQFSAVKPPEER
ncbi:MFS transporter [Microvirga sp. VF16]|uniref:MFS transporter n=1 Tax=Microvirga sp. VF16 TaxID=2807101 RepID=UPI00193D743C|nr:MFS transporter [Microvirga sp. VF16]QRM34504.1 MFS transporter [Microvirga sp. VF16]